MPVIIKKYSDQLIIILTCTVLVLLLILITDVHVARINQEVHKTVSQPF